MLEQLKDEPNFDAEALQDTEMYEGLAAMAEFMENTMLEREIQLHYRQAQADIMAVTIRDIMNSFADDPAAIEIVQVHLDNLHVAIASLESQLSESDEDHGEY